MPERASRPFLGHRDTEQSRPLGPRTVPGGDAEVLAPGSSDDAARGTNRQGSSGARSR